MKSFIFTTIICFFIGCSFDDGLTKVGEQSLKDKSIIELCMRGGGATDIDVIWVRKTTGTNQKFIGRIKWYLNGFDTKIWQVNDSLIKVRLTDTINWKGTFRDFTLNLNNKVEPNDGSMYADSTY